jgi:glucose/mannose transport system substrate-binding protein
MLAGAAGLMAAPLAARAQAVKPRLTAISQWSAGSDGAAITALGKKFEERGGVWQHSPLCCHLRQQAGHIGGPSRCMEGRDI